MEENKNKKSLLWAEKITAKFDFSLHLDCFPKE